MYVYNKYNNTKNYGIQQIFYIFTTTLPTTLSLRRQCVYILYIICLHCRCRILVKVILAVVKQLKQLQRKSRKNYKASTGFNPWPLQYHLLLKNCWMTYDNKTLMHVELASVLNVCSFCLFVHCCCLFVCLFVCLFAVTEIQSETDDRKIQQISCAQATIFWAHNNNNNNNNNNTKWLYHSGDSWLVSGPYLFPVPLIIVPSQVFSVLFSSVLLVWSCQIFLLSTWL